MRNEDVIEELGALAFGSRLKRLSDQLLQDGIRIYRDAGIGFEPRWFPVVYFLKIRGPTSVMNLARGLGVSHPAINQISREIISANLVAQYKDVRDKRKRVLALTSHGRTVIAEAEPVWRALRNAMQEILDDVGGLTYVKNLEQALATRGFQQRFNDQYGLRSDESTITITTYEPAYQEAFARLNKQWINQYFVLEDADCPALENPQEYIIDPGGEIFFALGGRGEDKAMDLGAREGEILGTCALMMRDNRRGELAKMAVSPAARGRGIGQLLGNALVNLARERKLETLFLETNRILLPALGLYRKLGFRELPFPYTTSYGRADVYMELALD